MHVPPSRPASARAASARTGDAPRHAPRPLGRTGAARRAAALALALAAAGGLAIVPAPAAAQGGTWPAKTVKLVNAFPPGGPSDLLARALAPVLQQQFGQPFVVENKAGAAGNIGAETVARSAPDGHTVLFGIDTTVTVNPHLYKSMPFKASELKPVAILASSGLLLAVHPSTGAKSMKDLVAAGRGKGLNFSSAGSGSPGHLAVEVMSDAVPGIKLTHVPYKGNTPAVTAVVAGEVDGGVLATPGLLPHAQAGRVTALAVTSQQRSKLAPDLPTMAELGMKELTLEVMYVVMVPAATPDAIVQTLARAMLDAMKRPELQQRLTALDMAIEGQTGAAAEKKLAEASERYARVVKATDMKVD